MDDNDDALVTESDWGESFVLFGDRRDEALLDAIGEALVTRALRTRGLPRSPAPGCRRAAGSGERAAHPAAGRQGRSDQLAPKAPLRCGLRRAGHFS